MKKRKKQKRWRLWAESKIQGELCIRVLIYWVLCQFSLISTVVLFGIVSNAGDSGVMKFVVPGLVVSTLMLPLALFDMVKASNRFAGPIVSIRNHLRAFLETGKVTELEFRHGDHCLDLCDLLNELQSRVVALQNDQMENSSIRPNEIREECNV